MIKLLVVSLIIALLCLPVLASDQELKTDVDKSIENNQKFLEQNRTPEEEQLIIQQQEMLKTIDQVDVFKSLEDARKALKGIDTQQRYVK